MTEDRTVGTWGRVGLAAVGMAAATGAWGLFEAQWPTLRHVHVRGVLHGSGPPMRVLHISDLHLSQETNRLTDFVASLASLPHDLVVVTGDLLGDADMELAAVRALEPLVASGQPGIVVLGSNDFHGPVAKNPFRYLASDSSNGQHGAAGERLDTDLLVESLAERGWTVLRNEVAAVPTAHGTIAITGLDDPHMGPVPAADDVPAAPPGRCHLGVVHSPYRAALDLLASRGSDLILAGHTHGGQVCIPGIGALVTNCDLPASQARGLSRHGDVPLHVSAGLGTAKYTPIRVACRPEATLLTLLT